MLRSGLALFVLLAPLALAACQDRSDHAYCDVSKTGYEHALNEVNQRLTAYQGCLSRALGSEDCSAQFSDLSSAQSNLQHGASDVRQYCGKAP